MLFLEVVGHLAGAEVRSERHRARLHHLLHGRARIDAERLGADEAQHDAMLVHDDAAVPAACAHTVPHGANALVDPTRRGVPPRDICDARRVGFLPLPRQPRGEPVSLARLIPIDLPEPELLEPRPGPSPHAPLVVLAVYDHRPLGLELPWRLPAEGLN